ncbi:NADH:flavin oxidoreductase/NADH oxidase [Marmoricola endophyticus]|uniref:NADH:flavin oxidoreductase/NADH oxidase n=2 Tax=Marmoricola endophyticus TaxID=2040280 RepID=A0A917BT23_9ACTN|nr:NADH:flavin oxidoreductase/NADH oxidase [Marmoricola endophyticus]
MPSSSLSAFTSSRLTLRNRLAFIATVNNLGRNSQVTPELIAFYAARARGGAGLIVTEGLSAHPSSIPNGTVPLAYDADLVPGFTELAAACHRHGARILGQLWHVGRQALWNPTMRPWAPSGGRDPYSGVTARTMDESDIEDVIAGFVASADNLRRAGFDGVELHGAHGYLITQFLSPWSNHRTDRWGGDTTGRSTFLVELVRGIRDRCGESFAVGVKLTAHEYVDGGIDLQETQRIVRAVEAAGAAPDYWAVSQANFSPSLEYHVPDLSFPDVPFAELSRGVREATSGTPVMAVAKVPDVATADRLIDDGTADLVGMARAWLAEPDLVRKVESGEEPRPCTYCNVCWDFIHTGRPIACIYSPTTGRELATDAERPVTPEGRRTLRVVGAGPAGLEAARTAAADGHEVHLYERGQHSGGRLRSDAAVHGREPMARAADWLDRAVTSAGVTVHLGTAVDGDVVREWGPDDAVVVATGSDPEPPSVEGAAVLPIETAAVRPEELEGTVVVVDAVEEEPVYAFACEVASRGHRVLLLTPREAPARRVAYVSRIGVLRRLDEAGVEVHTLTEPVAVVGGRLRTRHVYSAAERDLGEVGSIVAAGPYRPGPLPDALREDPRVRGVVGDASSPRGYVAISHEAHDTVRGLVGVEQSEARA